MSRAEFLPRFRYPLLVMRCALLFHVYLPSRIVAILLFFLFRVVVSHKTVCAWVKKFGKSVDFPLLVYAREDVLICYADEKYTKVKGVWHYWWSLKDCFGNLIHSTISEMRDFCFGKKVLQRSEKENG